MVSRTIGLVLAALVGGAASALPQWISTTSSLLDASGVLSIDRPTRRLAAVAPLSRFRSVAQRGLRGFLEGGQFTPSSADACAQRCVADPFCLSFDLETSTQTCYISYADRYAHPDAFLEFPTGVYYEWQGVVGAPVLEPNGGRFHTQPAVRLLTAQRSATIYYQVVNTSTAAPPTADDVVSTGTIATSGDVIVLPPFACRIFTVAVKNGLQNSPLVVSNDYHIYASKYVFLIPHFNGDFHGLVTRIQLDIRGKKRPRPARFHEFSDYETLHGTGPYATQVVTIDMAQLAPSLRGFQSGFSAFGNAAFLNESYLVPAQDDHNYMVTTWRIVLAAQYVPHPQRVGTPTSLTIPAEYVYFVPYYNGQQYLGHVIRVLASTFDWTTPVIEQLNLTQIDPSLKGFTAAFTDEQAGFAYLVPKENDRGLHGKLVRLALDDFSPSGVRVLDLAAMNPRYVGFSSGFQYQRFAYLVPSRRPRVGDERTTNLRAFPVTSSGVVVRVDLSTFATAESIDLAAVDPRLAGFSDAVRVTHYAYFVPFMRVQTPDSVEVNPFSGLVARLDLRDFSTVDLLDLTRLDDALRGFSGGFAYKQYVVLVPHRSAFANGTQTVHSGKVVRIDTNDFSLHGVSVLDLPTSRRSQVPDMPDADLRGFSAGVASGKYGFFVPLFNGRSFSGSVCRINLDKFDEVQTLFLPLQNPALRGFSNAILSTTEEATLETDLFGEFQVRQGTTTPYEYIY